MAKESKYHHILVSGGAARVNFLNTSILNFATDYVFEYLVMDYNSAPSKKKAVALYEVFIVANSPYQLNCNELLGPTARIHALIAFYRESIQMNVLQRIALKGLRSAEKGIFDSFLPAIFRQEDVVAMGQWQALASAGKGPSMKGSVGLQWAKTRDKLVVAGFACIGCTC